MLVVALHGQSASGQRLQHDSGDPPWVDWWADWQQFSPSEFANLLPCMPVCLVGYSLGGDFIAQLTHTKLCASIRKIVVYESPVLVVEPARIKGADVLQIWNNYRPLTLKRRIGKQQSLWAWCRAYPSSYHLTGSEAGHIRFSFRPPYIQHAWDRSLNPEIESFINA